MTPSYASTPTTRCSTWRLGVGANTPGIIKYPFWQQVAENRNARYVQLNMGGVIAPARIAERSALYDGDAAEVISKLA